MLWTSSFFIFEFYESDLILATEFFFMDSSLENITSNLRVCDSAREISLLVSLRVLNVFVFCLWPNAVLAVQYPDERLN